MIAVPVLALCVAAVGQRLPMTAGLTDPYRVELERNLRWMLTRDADPRATVGVVADAGVWHVGAKAVVEALEAHGVRCRVLDRSRLNAAGLAGLTGLVLPGGWAPYQWAAAGPVGLDAIRTFVASGGRCLGICAGAYLLASTTAYDGAEYAYPLGLFDGTARGPVPGLARFPTPGRVRLTATADGERVGLHRLADADCYYSGGPCFVGGTGATTLARYPDGSAAVVRRVVGNGQVTLIGGHIERPAPPEGADDTTPPHAGELFRALLAASK